MYGLLGDGGGCLAAELVVGVGAPRVELVVLGQSHCVFHAARDGADGL